MFGLLAPICVPASAKQWDMATGFAYGNYQTYLARQFAVAVGGATGLAIGIRVHSNGSLIPANQIKKSS